MASRDNLQASTAFGAFLHRGHHGRAGPAGVTVSERSRVAVAGIGARKGQTAALSERIAERTGLILPQTPQLVGRDHIGFVWTAPNQWLAMSDGEDGAAFAADLARDLAGLASVTDQTDGRAMLRLSGPRVRDALAKGCMLDLDARVFKQGHTAITLIALLTSQITRLEDTDDHLPVFEIAVMRSFAGNLWHWLEASSAEFGLDVC